MRRAALAALLLAAACKKGPDPEIARLNGVLESLRKEMADERDRKEREIAGLRAQLEEATRKAGEADSGLAALKAASEATVRDLKAGLEAKAKEAATALAQVADLEKMKAGLDTSLKEAKSLLDKRSKDYEALKAELTNLKKLLGK